MQTNMDSNQAPSINDDSHYSDGDDYFRNLPTTKPDKHFPSVNLIRASDVVPMPIHWLWEGWLAKGKLHILAGMAGTGKTTLSMTLAATISQGGLLPDGSNSPVGSVLIWSGEDSAGDTLVPRLMAAGADLDKVHFVEHISEDHEKRSFDPATDMPLLLRRAATIDDLALLIIDPVVNAVAGDGHKNGDVRRGLQPVVDFAEKLDCAVIGITHVTKGTQGKEPLERVTGSLAYGALARVVLFAGRVLEGASSRRMLCRAKSNIGGDHGGYAYDLLEREVLEGVRGTYALWGELMEGSALELLSEPDGRESNIGGLSALDRAKDFLTELLMNGELPQKMVENEANNAGVSWATIRRAKDELNIISSKSVLDKRWYWKLPNYLLKNE